MDISTLVGKTFTSVVESEYDGNVAINFISENESYKIYHSQDCCESICLEDINGELSWLENTPIISAYESTDSKDDEYASETWSFYRISTIKGTVVMRFCGSSNGYYSETMFFDKI